MRRCAAFLGAVSIATATGLLLFSAPAADNPNRLSQLGDRAQVTRPAAAAVHSPGDAVVTGFSGVRPPPQVAPGVDPLDKTFIDLDGPAVRVIDLSNPGAPAQGQVIPARNPFTVTARQTGQVFAVALDDATPPNIYVGATSAYGLPIVAAQPDRDGTPRRLRRGEAGAQFMPGLFGPAAAGGGPGSIWKIDSRTGAVSLFANIPNSGAGLGDIVFDSEHRQFFVSDRASGLIHRIGLDGGARGTFDHGTVGRAAVGLVPVPDRPERRVNIHSPAFDPSNPQSWNLPPPARRTFGLAIYKNRLFYALAEGPQVWSVSLAPDGGFGTSASWELTLPPSPRPVEVASILFDDEGQIYLAERGASTGAYDFKALSSPGDASVLRYRLREPSDPPGPGRWAPVPDEYSVGYRPNYRNTNGGLAFGYRYAQNNTFAGCGGTLWTTGEQLRAASDPALAQQLTAFGPLALHGVQGVAVDLLRPRNTPPQASLFVRYDDRVAEAAAREHFGHMGDLAIWQSCGAPPARLVLTCPIGFYWNGFTRLCELPVAAVTCPPGQRWDGRACAGIICWGAQRFDGRQCVCPPNMVWNDQRCMPGRVCPTGQVLDGERCVPGRVCPIGQVSDGERCVPTPRCPTGQAWDGQTQACVCPAGQDSNGMACQCPPGQYFSDSSCQPSNGAAPKPPPGDQPGNCPRGQIQHGDLCIVVDPVPEPPGDQPPPSDQPPPPPGSAVCSAGETPLCCSPGFTGKNVAVACAPPQRGTNRCQFPLIQVCCTPQADGSCITPPRFDRPPQPRSCQGPGDQCCARVGSRAIICAPAHSAAGCQLDSVCCTEEQRTSGTCKVPETSPPTACTAAGATCCINPYGNPMCGPPTADGYCLGASTCCPPGSTASACVRPPPPPQPDSPRCEPVGESRPDRCSRLFSNDPVGYGTCIAAGSPSVCLTFFANDQTAYGTCLKGPYSAMCFANSDCAEGACCGRDGYCHAGPRATSVPPPPQTCPEGQTRQGDRCVPACTSGRVWNGEFCVCPNNGTWTGTSCATASEKTRERPQCRTGTRWNGEACVSIRTQPKCKRGTRWDGERCRPISRPPSTPGAEPQTTPGFSIGIGIGGGGGRSGRGPRGPGRGTPPPSGGGGGLAN